MVKLTNQLQTEFGSAWTPEMTKYVVKIKNDLLYDTNYVTNHRDGHGMWKDDTYNAVVHSQSLINEFLRRFDEMCKNNGQTDSEVAADKEAKKSDYQNFLIHSNIPAR